MTIPVISSLPEIPAYSDANFETKAPAVLSALRNTFVAEMNAAIAAINNYDYGAAVNISKVVGLTAGYIPYGAGTSALASNANLNYDAVNSRLNTPVLRASTGVLFGTDTAAANTLDDYEEGTWTITATSAGGGTITLDSGLGNTGHYTKIGDRVFISGYIEVDSVSSPLGGLRISIPINSGSTNTKRSAVAVLGFALEATAATQIIGIIGAGVSYLTLVKFAAGADSALAPDVKAGSKFYFNGQYIL